MTTFERLLNSRQHTTSISRDGTDIYGPRLVSSDAVVLAVHTFPFSAVATVTAGGALALPAAYLLVGGDASGNAAYVGETGNLGRRMQEHAADDSKAFAAEVFAITSSKQRTDKNDLAHWQQRLSDLVEEAGVARLIKGVNPCRANVTPQRAAELDRMLADALPLVFDAGCRCLLPAPLTPCGAAAGGTLATAPAVTPAVAAEDDDGDDGGPLEIGVTTVPIGAEEQELVYADLWARGYEHQGRFVVAAGSEMRKEANPSANALTIERRNELIEKGAAVLIEDRDDRYRLERPVGFPSLSIAGKVLTGAHGGSEKWRPLRTAAPVIIAG